MNGKNVDSNDPTVCRRVEEKPSQREGGGRHKGELMRPKVAHRGARAKGGWGGVLRPSENTHNKWYVLSILTVHSALRCRCFKAIAPLSIDPYRVPSPANATQIVLILQ